jgi:uncharacterized membrane protein
MLLHPALVHFPIALLIAAGVFYGAARFREAATMYRAGWLLHLAGLVSVVVAVLSGNAAQGDLVLTPSLEADLKTHQLLGYATLWVFALLAVWQYLRQGRGQPREQWLFLMVYWLGLGLMAYGAWHGGHMVYAHGAGVAPVP